MTLALLVGLEGMNPPAGSAIDDTGFPQERRPPEAQGIEFPAEHRQPVLAVADGYVVHKSPYLVDGSAPQCGGVSVVIEHRQFGYLQTRYCHLAERTVQWGPVKRGDVIGFVGETGTKGGKPHLLFEILRLWVVVEPLEYQLAGCFDPEQQYPTDRFVPTFPLKCRQETKPSAQNHATRPEDLMEEALAVLCRSYPYAFTMWDKETKRCLAIDLSSDQVYEP